MVALNRTDELRIRPREALNNGVTREEIREVLLQTAIYCGALAANSAFHLAQEVFAPQDKRFLRLRSRELAPVPATRVQPATIFSTRMIVFQRLLRWIANRCCPN